MFICNVCKKEYENSWLEKFSYYTSRQSGVRHIFHTCTYCSAEADNKTFKYVQQVKPWKDLSDKYPRIFNSPSGTDIFGKTIIKPAPVAGGVGMGWYELIAKACEEIQVELDKLNPEAYCNFHQMKEKFGGLRWYTSTPIKNKFLYKISSFINSKMLATNHKHPDWYDKILVKYKLWRFRVPYPKNKIQEIIDEAERKSYKICEECGRPGVLRQGGWIKTACDEHSNNEEPLDYDSN